MKKNIMKLNLKPIIISTLVIITFIFGFLYIKTYNFNKQFECIEKYYRYDKDSEKYIKETYTMSKLKTHFEQNKKNGDLGFLCISAFLEVFPPFEKNAYIMKNYNIQGCYCLTDMIIDEDGGKKFEKMLTPLTNYIIEYNKLVMEYFKEKE